MEKQDFDYYKKIETKVLKRLGYTEELNMYSHNDAYYINKEKKEFTIIEFKNRQMGSTIFPSHYLEMVKYNDLLDVMRNYKKTFSDYKFKILYVNQFTDNVIYIYNLSSVAKILKNGNPFDNSVFYKEKIWMNSVTASGTDRSNLKELKWVYSLYRFNPYRIINS